MVDGYGAGKRSTVSMAVDGGYGVLADPIAIKITNCGKAISEVVAAAKHPGRVAGKTLTVPPIDIDSTNSIFVGGERGANE
jgi:hypothetical protein